ncbi:MAG: hypothetical protein AAF197_04075, partial [Pseudomonadota bacterium]
MGILGKDDGGRDATREELAKYDQYTNELREMEHVDRYDAEDPNQRLMVLAFDATRSDRLKPGTKHTNPDILEELVVESDRVSSFYVHGVGTRSATKLGSWFEMITGAGSIERAELAYRQLVEQVQDWYRENPNVEIHVSTIGFSRGVGSQRHFANLVEDLGIPNESCTGYLIEPGAVKQDLMFMYDGVVTGQEKVLDLPIPASVGYTSHLVAEHEKREAFDLASTHNPLLPNQPNRDENAFAGGHTNMGGEETYQGLSARTLEMAHIAFANAGVPL